MCGIVGYIGKGEAVQALLNGLKRLEYRGYDSAGITCVEGDALHTIKVQGKVGELAERVWAELPPERASGLHLGIAHTRWATHGAPTESNAHPHLDQSGRLALVHNGIIENYAEIRRQLEGKGHEFLSETDSEVLAHLIGEYYEDDLLRAVCDALHYVEGAYGIAVVSLEQPDRIVVARNGSPVAIGLGEGETIVASDASALVSHTSRVIFLDDGDVALVTADGAELCNLQYTPVTREVAELDWDGAAAEKGGFEHFMLKEIFEQPEALRNTIRGRLDPDNGTALLSGLRLEPADIIDIPRVTLVGCGTSMYACMSGEYFFEELADLPADVEQAAEFRYRNPIVHARDMVIAVTQSGETADTLAAVREAKQKGALVAAINNVVASTIARETGRGVYLHAGPEIGVASTKAFTCQVTVLLMMALKFGRTRRLSRQAGIDICRDIQEIPSLVERVLEQNDHIAAVAEKYCQAEDMFFIGRGWLYPVALEGALKIKEISYLHAEGYHAAELKHGPIALLEERVPVVALVNDVPGKDKTLSNLLECRARRSPVIALATEGDESINGEHAEDIIRLPKASPQVVAVPSVVALQLLAYHVARLRGCSIDQPRNLAKSVTVE